MKQFATSRQLLLEGWYILSEKTLFYWIVWDDFSTSCMWTDPLFLCCQFLGKLLSSSSVFSLFFYLFPLFLSFSSSLSFLSFTTFLAFLSFFSVFLFYIFFIFCRSLPAIMTCSCCLSPMACTDVKTDAEETDKRTKESVTLKKKDKKGKYHTERMRI